MKKKMRRRARFLLLIFVVCAAAHVPGASASVWTTAVGGNWTDVGNWQSGVAPNGATAVIDLTSLLGSSTIFYINGSYPLANLQIAGGTLSLSGNLLVEICTVSPANPLSLVGSGAERTLNVTGADIVTFGQNVTLTNANFVASNATLRIERALHRVEGSPSVMADSIVFGPSAILHVKGMETGFLPAVYSAKKAVANNSLLHVDWGSYCDAWKRNFVFGMGSNSSTFKWRTFNASFIGVSVTDEWFMTYNGPKCPEEPGNAQEKDGDVMETITTIILIVVVVVFLGALLHIVIIVTLFVLVFLGMKTTLAALKGREATAVGDVPHPDGEGESYPNVEEVEGSASHLPPAAAVEMTLAGDFPHTREEEGEVAAAGSAVEEEEYQPEFAVTENANPYESDSS